MNLNIETLILIIALISGLSTLFLQCYMKETKKRKIIVSILYVIALISTFSVLIIKII
jgi:hypothetical protein